MKLTNHEIRLLMHGFILGVAFMYGVFTVFRIIYE